MGKLNEVYRVKAQGIEGLFVLSCNVTTDDGETFDCDYASYADDVYGLNPLIRKWLEENAGTYEIEPHVPVELSQEEVRAQMPSLSPRQLRLGLVRNGISLADVEAAIEAMPAGAARDEARIEWEYAPAFKRTHPLISAVGSAVGLNDEQIDTMWQTAIGI